jgi:hypothetical protein
MSQSTRSTAKNKPAEPCADFPNTACCSYGSKRLQSAGRLSPPRRALARSLVSEEDSQPVAPSNTRRKRERETRRLAGQGTPLRLDLPSIRYDKLTVESLPYYSTQPFDVFAN